MITIDREALKELVREVLGELLQGDRRTQPRPNGAKAKAVYHAPPCKVKGCRNPGVNLWGGYCKTHRKPKKAAKRK